MLLWHGEEWFTAQQSRADVSSDGVELNGWCAQQDAQDVCRSRQALAVFFGGGHPAFFCLSRAEAERASRRGRRRVFFAHFRVGGCGRERTRGRKREVQRGRDREREAARGRERQRARVQNGQSHKGHQRKEPGDLSKATSHEVEGRKVGEKEGGRGGEMSEGIEGSCS